VQEILHVLPSFVTFGPYPAPGQSMAFRRMLPAPDTTHIDVLPDRSRDGVAGAGAVAGGDAGGNPKKQW